MEQIILVNLCYIHSFGLSALIEREIVARTCSRKRNYGMIGSYWEGFSSCWMKGMLCLFLTMTFPFTIPYICLLCCVHVLIPFLSPFYLKTDVLTNEKLRCLFFVIVHVHMTTLILNWSCLVIRFSELGIAYIVGKILKI